MQASRENTGSSQLKKRIPGRGDAAMYKYKDPSHINRSHTLHRTMSKGTTNIQNTSDQVYCVACSQPIQGLIIEALNETWHQEHFTCAECRKPISGNKFNVHDGKPFCEEDYAAKFLKKCASCKQPITDVVVVALNQTWHRNHFICCLCGGGLANKGFFERENTPYCQPCYERKFMPKCQECEHPITDTAIMALGEKWHQACFKCQVCSKPITDTTFEVLHNRPLCSSCETTGK